jgi:hypothetical protein
VLLLGACATDGPLPTKDAPGYWSSVEDVGANPPPRSDLDAGDETFYPYVQTPRMGYGRGFDASIGYGFGYGYDPYYAAWGAGFMGAFPYDPFFYRADPFYPGIFVPVPIVVTRPPAPPPVSHPPPPPASHPPVRTPRPPPGARPQRLPPPVSAPATPQPTSRTRMTDRTAQPKPD